MVERTINVGFQSKFDTCKRSRRSEIPTRLAITSRFPFNPTYTGPHRPALRAIHPSNATQAVRTDNHSPSLNHINHSSDNCHNAPTALSM